MKHVERDPSRLFGAPRVEMERRADGCVVLRSGYGLEPGDRCVGQWLVRWSREVPGRPFLLERSAAGYWRGVTYAEALERVERVGAWLLSRRLGAQRPLAILSDNSVEHGLLALAALQVGIPVMPVSPAYSLLSRDFGKLKAVFSQTHPGAVYVSDYARFAPALAAVSELHAGLLIVGNAAPVPAGGVSFGELLASEPDRTAVRRAFEAITPDTVAKLLFTSGSTGEPKAVINTQRMLCSNQQANAQLWRFIVDAAPVIVDWLPWNHTFGGNFNFNMVLRHGGTLYIDGGRPVSGLFEQTVANLREIAPTVYFNVPRAYDMLITALTADEALRVNFFSRLQVIFYAAAALPQNVWERLSELAEGALGQRVALVSSWGSTETAPLAAACYFQAERSGNIGLPIPGCELKLCPSGEKLEARVRGPNVTPGYFGQPELTRRSFDAEGFYFIGDAVRFADEQHPERGLYFDGRVAEDFKLTSGTWVSVGALRIAGIEALAPLAQDIVVAGHDREWVGFLVFPNVGACRALCSELPPETPLGDLLAHPAVLGHVAKGLRRLHRASTGSSSHAAAALLLEEPPSIDQGEITDKGYINQRVVLARRMECVVALYSDLPDARVVRLDSP